MDFLAKDKILEHNPDTLEAVRKDLGLWEQARIEESIDILDDWIKKQNHFVKKDFPRRYLEVTLVTSKGLIERAKEKIEKLCTFRTLMPQYFTNMNVEDFSELKTFLCHAHIPKLTKEHQRVYLCKYYNNTIDSNIMCKYFRNVVLLSEYIKKSDYCSGFQLILDFRDSNVMNFVTTINPMELRHFMVILMEGYGMRIKGIHIITASKMVDALVGLLKQGLSAKVAGRMKVQKNLDSLYDILPRDIFPVDYGGKEISLKELNEKWLGIVGSQEFMEYYENMLEARTNESCRLSNDFNVEYAGMPGSFRALTVD